MANPVTGQIIFLEYRQTRLYAEVIQVLGQRQMGWLRPLAFVDEAGIQPLGTALLTATIGDNRPTAPDLLWPLNQLQFALDTDVLPLLATLGTKPPATFSPGQKVWVVNEFLQQVWAEHETALKSNHLT
ncbi:hypothetical protein IQ254_08265 [Nodosilinea sp. LEGE 07088]|uniref:hypothetical protein n=1 Tax=Nodosilinea sp. LEGE 07088 TaxID=2777968 RepID=UPI00187E2DEA|nr:hypothetical protein [Nodosilinea sp. LEGE 07088]MBE9137198.1 hypothetical protein [Nodosilinea sp. LEGE 07088]